MKSSSIPSFLLAAAMFTPSLQAQDAPAKIREIERRVMLERYRKGVQTLIQSTREFENGNAGITSDIVGKHAQLLTVINENLGGEDKAAALDRQNMRENAVTLNELAWNMIIPAEAGNRHPEVALKLADIAMELGGEDAALKVKILDSRARALFLLGRRDEAIADEEKAFAAATIAVEKAEFGATLAAYRKNELPAVYPRTGGRRVNGLSGAARILEKLKNIIIPSVEIENETLEEVIASLRKEVSELDTTEPDAAHKGVNIVIKAPAGSVVPASGQETDKLEPLRIKELRLRNVPLAEALRYICDATHLRYKVDDFAVTITPLNGPEDLFSRVFTVPPGFGGATGSIQDFLKKRGVEFGEGASASLDSDDGTLLIRNTPSQLDKIEALVVAAGKGQVADPGQPAAAPEFPAPPTPKER